jgi:hypothetical protein
LLLFILKHQMMDKVQEANNLKCDIMLLESYRNAVLILSTKH